MERLRHFTSSKQCNLGFIIHILKSAARIEAFLKTEEGAELLTYVLRGKIIGELFWQASSRTFHSFLSAAYALGASVGSERGIKAPKVFWQWVIDFFISIFKKVQEKYILLFSSEMKDAYYEDEIRAFASSYDLLVLRTGRKGLVDRAAEIIEKSLGKIRGFTKHVPVISGGDGDGEHPSQTLIDVCALFRGLHLDPENDFGKLQNLHISFVNDGRHSRTVHSLAWTLGVHFKMVLHFVSRKGLEMSKEFLDELREHRVKFFEHSFLVPSDILYVQRPQDEYYGAFGKLWQNILKLFGKKEQYFSITKEVADKLGVKLVLHPFPRSKKYNELPIWEPSNSLTENISLDTDSRAGYFEQMSLAKPIRMALLVYFLRPKFDYGKLKQAWLERSFITQCGACGCLESTVAGWGDKPVRRVEYLPGIPFCPECLQKNSQLHFDYSQPA